MPPPHAHYARDGPHGVKLGQVVHRCAQSSILNCVRDEHQGGVVAVSLLPHATDTDVVPGERRRLAPQDGLLLQTAALVLLHTDADADAEYC